MSKKALFILNPHSGKGLIKNHLLEIMDILVKADYEVTVYPTQSRGDAERVMRERDKDYELVVCSGGDGTLDEIVTGMIQSGFKTTIGYIPAGSTNDFARSLKIPGTMKKAAEVIVAGNVFACDVGRFNRDVFVYIAAFGLFTEVSYGTPQEMKNMLGHMAYILEGMRRLSSIKSYHMKVESEEVSVEAEFLFGMITNSTSVGGFKRITGKYVQLDDGEFEVVLIKKPANPMELNLVMAALINRRVNTDCMYCFKTSSLKITSGEEVAWTLDGEFGGKHREVDICNLKKALAIRVP